MKLTQVTRKEISYVELERDEDHSLGFTIKDEPQEGRPVIENVSINGPAAKSYAVAAGDVIWSVNEFSTAGKKSEIVRQMLNKGQTVYLELLYKACETRILGSCVYSKRRLIHRFKKINGNFGFLVRKGSKLSLVMEYPVISNIKEGSPIHKFGGLQDGDRLLAIDNVELSWMSLYEIAFILDSKDEAEFTFEYNVRVENFPEVDARVDLEIDAPVSDLGITFRQENKKMYINSIRQGSAAERCGLFNEGDIVLSINDIHSKNSKAVFLENRKEIRKISFISNSRKVETPKKTVGVPSTDFHQEACVKNHSESVCIGIDEDILSDTAASHLKINSDTESNRFSEDSLNMLLPKADLCPDYMKLTYISSSSVSPKNACDSGSESKRTLPKDTIGQQPLPSFLSDDLEKTHPKSFFRSLNPPKTLRSQVKVGSTSNLVKSVDTVRVNRVCDSRNGRKTIIGLDQDVENAIVNQCKNTLPNKGNQTVSHPLNEKLKASTSTGTKPYRSNQLRNFKKCAHPSNTADFTKESAADINSESSSFSGGLANNQSSGCKKSAIINQCKNTVPNKGNQTVFHPLNEKLKASASTGTKSNRSNLLRIFPKRAHPSNTADFSNESAADNNSESSSSSSSSSGGVANKQNPGDKKTYSDTRRVTLKKEGNGDFGLDVSDKAIITAIAQKSPSHKAGVLKCGDRILAINGKRTSKLSLRRFSLLKSKAFHDDTIQLTVQFDVAEENFLFGVFDVVLDRVLGRSLQIGLIFKDSQEACPMVISGVVKGSAAHRCGQLFPGDQVTEFQSRKIENYNPLTRRYNIEDVVVITVFRDPKNVLEFNQKDELSSYMAPCYENPAFYPEDSMQISRHNFEVKKTTVHSSRNDFVKIENELTLYRDSSKFDFGILLGVDETTGHAYVKDIRPDGPADKSGVVRKFDRIIKVNGELVNKNVETSIVGLFARAGKKVDLVVRRVCKEFSEI